MNPDLRNWSRTIKILLLKMLSLS
jgi:hypothetical protein